MIMIFPKLLDAIVERSTGRGLIIGPWRTHLGIGKSTTSKIEKAAIARVGLGANSKEETIYWNAFTDSDGVALNSENEYHIVIAEDLAVDFSKKGFWSITVYGSDKYLVNNPRKKYLVRRDCAINPSEDEPYIILLSKSNIKDFENYIPLPSEPESFSLALRCYRPKKEMQNPDSIERLNFPKIVKI